MLFRCTMYPVFRVLPDQAIRADHLAQVMVGAAGHGIGSEHHAVVFENRDIRALVAS